MRDPVHAKILLNMCSELLELWSRVHAISEESKNVFEAPTPPLFGEIKSVDWITDVEVACVIALRIVQATRESQHSSSWFSAVLFAIDLFEFDVL